MATYLPREEMPTSALNPEDIQVPLSFAYWPRVSEWRVDDSLSFGSFRWERTDNRVMEFYASAETLNALSKYRQEEPFNDYIRAYGPWPDEIKTEYPEPKDQTIREQVLDEAKRLTVGDREDQYGSPLDHFTEVVGILNSLGYRGPNGRDILPHDIPVIQIAVKLSRIVKTPLKRDSWVDTSGYASIGAEVAELGTKNA